MNYIKHTRYFYFSILVAFLFSAVFVNAQPYNNSWINYTQQYYSFKVSKSGLYRIDSLALQNAGINVSSIDPRNIQIFGKGSELALYVEGESDGVFNSNDYIEFYAEHNDGWFDQQLYGSSQDHPNKYFSLFNDTLTYFLTWSTSLLNNRITLETDTNFIAYTQQPYFLKKTTEIYTTNYYDGATNLYGGTDVKYVNTEGWFDSPINLGTSKVRSISTKNVYAGGVNAELNAVVLGQSDYAPVSTGDHHLRVSIAGELLDTIFEGYKKIDVNLSINPNNLGNNTTQIAFSSINDLGVATERNAVAWHSLIYPHTNNLEGLSEFEMLIPNSILGTKAYHRFSNFVGVGTPLLYDITNNKRIVVKDSSGVYKCLIPNSSGNKKCYLTFPTNIQNISQLNPVNGTGFFTDFSNTPADSCFLIITHPNLMSGASQYNAYRSITSHRPVIVNIEELYNQFAYGINKHATAIRHFVDYIYATWNTPPHYLFLLGKSITAKNTRFNTFNYALNMVPTLGNPSSDNYITAGLHSSLYEPLIPTGRLAAKNNVEIGWYLDKINQFENPALGPNGETEWMKRVLHFAGGTNNNEAQLFMSYLNGYKSVIEDTLFGGNVISFAKTTTAPIQTTMSDSILNYIGEGVSIMTFFGHASATGGFDQNIDHPSSWPNQNGKYPFLIGNACLAGDIHLPSSLSISEEYVIENNKGTIGFLASVGLGLTSSLNIYSSELYKNIAYKNYGKSVGSAIKKTIQNIQGNGSNTTIVSTVLEMTLHGDPSIVINKHDLPDYMLTSSNVYFNPTQVSTEVDSFDVNVVVTNLGRAINDTIILELIRDFPDQNFQDSVYVKYIHTPHFKDTITFTLPVDPVKGVGLNKFTITVDVVNQIAELYETNNQITKNLNILSGDIIPVYPYKFSIVPSQGINLIASTGVPFLGVKKYIFELDTTDLFNSAIKQTTTINSSGGIISWIPNLLQNMTDSTVYFWRVSKDSIDANGYSWKESSFQYIPNKKGWEQDHFFQFKNNNYQYINYNRPARKFDFINTVSKLRCETYGAAIFSELYKIAYYVDASKKGSAGWLSNSSFHVAILDSNTLEPYSSATNNFGQANQGNTKPNFFIYRINDPIQLNAMIDALIDSVPNGNHILVWTWYYNTFTNHAPISAPVKNMFQALGATQIPILANDSLPFIFYVKKGSIATASEVVGDSINHKNLQLTKNLQLNASYGRISSALLGPATQWDSLFWKTNALEQPTKDSSVLNVFGVDLAGNETLIINNLPDDSLNMSITSSVNASVYPYLKLQSYLSDDSLQTSPQLDRWHVTYEGVPEVALSPNIYFWFDKDTVQEGENINFSVAVKNISTYDMDSLLVKFELLNKYSNLSLLGMPRYNKVLADSVLIISYQFSTFGFPGLNALLIDVNPNNDQLEQYHFNNVGQYEFYVIEDKINPILDVTFDGVHILDGDIVSPKTEIVVQLTDENQFLALDDTSDFSIYLTYPTGQEKRVYFYNGTQQQMNFIPASLPKNSCKIIYRGNFKKDGVYKLRVRANDKSDNQSGQFDYLIRFEVINKSTITNVLNYPNPFTTATKFVFTLTGSVIPDIFKIQIMTITGKVVKEIHKEELGPIKIGRNITEYTWDGTDMFGDRLANGVYLYTVTTKINDNDIEHRDSNADKYFKKNFGKMYLLR